MEDICTICSDKLIDTRINFCVAECGHTFHLKCMGSLIASSGNSSKCPDCRSLNLTGKDEEGKSNVEDLTEKFCRLLDVPASNLESKIQRYALLDRVVSMQIPEQENTAVRVFYLFLSDLGNTIRIFKITSTNLNTLTLRYSQGIIFNSKLVKVFDQLSMLPRHYEQIYPELSQCKLDSTSVKYAVILDRVLCTDESNTNILYRFLTSSGNEHINGTTILQFVRSFSYDDQTVAKLLNLGYRGCMWVFVSGINKGNYCFKNASNVSESVNPLNYRCTTCLLKQSNSLCFRRLSISDGIVFVI